MKNKNKITKWVGLACAVACSAVVFAGCDLANTGAKDYINQDPNAQYVQLNNTLYDELISGKYLDNLEISMTMDIKGDKEYTRDYTFYTYDGKYMLLMEDEDSATLYIGDENGNARYSLASNLASVTSKESDTSSMLDMVYGPFAMGGFGIVRVSEVDFVSSYNDNCYIAYSYEYPANGTYDIYNQYVVVAVNGETNKIATITHVKTNNEDSTDSIYYNSTFKYDNADVPVKMESLYILTKGYQG